jgi:hypothetical protein
MKILETVGNYQWQVTQSFNKEKFKDLKEWDTWRYQRNLEFIKSFNLQKGDNVIITIGGTGTIRTYKGTFEGITGNDKNHGYFIHLQQKVKLKVIDGWQIVDILKL